MKYFIADTTARTASNLNRNPSQYCGKIFPQIAREDCSCTARGRSEQFKTIALEQTWTKNIINYVKLIPGF